MATGGIGEEGEHPLVLHSEDIGGSWCRLTLRGELDLDSAPRLRRAVEDAVGRGRNRFSIDAAAVTFIDSSGLMVLLNARSELADGGGTLHITDPSGPVMRILEIAMLADELIAPDGDQPPGEGPPSGSG
jgi:anti-sigma B factor antagonist